MRYSGATYLSDGTVSGEEPSTSTHWHVIAVDGVYSAVAGSGIELSGNTISVADESITVEKVADDLAAVINAKEVKDNKKTTLTGNELSNDYYPTTKAVADALSTKVPASEVGDLKSALDDVYDNNGVPAQNLTISDFTSQDCYKTNGESQVFGEDWVSTDFIPCYGSTVKYKGYAFWSSSVDLAVVAFFGVDKQMTHCIASSEVLSAIGNGTVSGEVSTQPGDYYVRVISYTSRVPDSYVVVSAGNLYSKLSVVDDLSDAVGTIGDLKSAFNEDLIGSIAWIDGHHAFEVGMDAYNLHTYDANYHCTNYFPVADGVFRYNGVPMSLNDLKSFTGSSSNNVVIFSKNGKIVGRYRNGNKEYSDDGDGMSIDFYGSNYTLLTVSPDYAMLSDLYKGTEQNKSDIQFISNEIENNIMSAYYGIGANIFNKNDVVFNGEYYGDDGEVHQFQGSGYGYSKLIPISGGTTYYFSKPHFFNFYDSSKAFISGGHSSADGNRATAPQTAAYLRVSLTEANKDSMMVVANGLPSEYVPFAYQLSDGLKQDFSNLKICCIGDSLTQGVNGDTTDYDTTFIKENYPYYMGKTLKNTGILNYGRYGATPITWYNNYKSNFATPDETYDAALIMLGTNGGISDTLDTDVEPYNSYSDYANTTCGCYCKIIEWLLDVTSNHICIVLVTPPTNWIADRPDKYTVVKNSVEVIKKIAARYSLPVIDVFNDSGISKYQSAIFRPYDGLHFVAKGYHKIGTFIGNQFMSIYSTFGNTDADTVTGGVIFNE